MVRTAALIAVLMLSGCNDMPQARTENEIREIAKSTPRADIAVLQSDVADLRLEINQLKAENAKRAKAISDSFEYTESIAQQVSGNAQAANENALKDMTRRGACGYRTVRRKEGEPLTNPIISAEPIPCTLQDLQKK